MSLHMTAAAEESTQVGNTWLNLAIFAGFVAITMVFVIRAGRTNKSASDMYTGGGAFTGRQNGIAISGDYLSAASFLGIAGAIALAGYDGFLYSVGFLVAWLVALLLVAEFLRNTGRFTMADVLAFRMRERPVRTAAATSTLVVSFFYLLAQMAGAGGLVALLMNITGRFEQSIVIAVVGALMIAYVLIGGMKGTTYVQIIKAILLISGAGIDDLLGAGQLRDEFLRSAGCGSRGRRAVGARRQVRPVEPHQDRFHLARPGAGARHGRPAAHSDAVLHRADGQGGPQICGVGDRADRSVLPVHPGPGLRCGSSGRSRRPSRRPRAGPIRPLRCLPTSSAGRSCWGSSPRWPSRRFLLSSPG